MIKLIGTDWNKVFTDAFHSDGTQKILNKWFPNDIKRRKFSKEELEGLVVGICSDIMRILYEGKNSKKGKEK